MDANEIIAKINSIDGLTATLESADTDATPEHIGLVLVELDSSVPRFHKSIKHDAVGDIVDGVLRELGLSRALAFADSDDALSEAWYRIIG